MSRRNVGAGEQLSLNGNMKQSTGKNSKPEKTH